MKIKDIYTSSKAWTQLVYARKSDNEPCWWAAEDACKFCLSGAILKVYGNKEENAKISKLVAQEMNKGRRYFYSGIVEFNDSNSFETIRELVNKLDI